MKELTREEVAQLIDREVIEKLYEQHCDFTNRVIEGDEVEFASSVDFVDADGIDRKVTAYYYQPKSVVMESEDLSNLDWRVSHYTID